MSRSDRAGEAWRDAGRRRSLNLLLVCLYSLFIFSVLSNKTSEELQADKWRRAEEREGTTRDEEYNPVTASAHVTRLPFHPNLVVIFRAAHMKYGRRADCVYLQCCLTHVGKDIR